MHSSPDEVHRILSNSQVGTIEDIDRHFQSYQMPQKKIQRDTKTGLDEPNKPKSGDDFLHSRASFSWNLLAIIVVISGFVGNWAQTIDPTGFLLSPPHAGEFLYSIKFARSKVQVPVPTIFPIRLARDYLDQWPAAEQFPL